MNSSKKNSNPSSSTDFDLIPLELLVSLATGPLVLGLIGGKALSEAVREIGQLSEELFRGDRLPLLKFPVPSASTPDTSSNNADPD